MLPRRRSRLEASDGREQQTRLSKDNTGKVSNVDGKSGSTYLGVRGCAVCVSGRGVVVARFREVSSSRVTDCSRGGTFKK